jgi:hypothetical protein
MEDVLIRQIQNGASTLFVLTPEEFLYEFNSLTYVKTELLNRIRSLIPTLTLITEGGLGKIYTFGPNHVLKITNTCIEPLQEQNITIRNLCYMATNNSIVYKIENTLMKKQIVFCPNFYSEGIIGSLLQNLRLNTPSFVKINGTILDNINPKLPMYIVMERAQPFPYNEPDQSIFMYYIFQIIFALYISQYTMKFTHYDLHYKNILSKPRTDGNNIKKYVIKNISTGETKYLYTKHNIDALIIDFGFSRCETEKHIIVPRYELQTETNDLLQRKFHDSLEFNSYYDIASLLNSIRINIPEYSALAFTLLQQYLQAHPENYFFNDTFWRPIPENLYRGIRPLPIYVFLENICRTYFTNVDPISIIDLNNKLDVYNFIYTNLNVNLNPTDFTYKLPNPIYNIKNYLYQPFPIDTINYGLGNNYRLITRYSNKIINNRSELGFDPFFKPYNFTPPPSRTNTLEQYITSVVMNQPSNSNPFKFRTDCCRLDMRTYFQNDIFTEGVAINASFFNINTNYESVGLYKSNYYMSDNMIPLGYENYYASIVIDAVTNILSIIPVADARYNMNNYSGIITAGPLIIENNKSLITENFLINHRELQCRLYNILDPDSNAKIFNDGIPNCNKTEPGQLKHLSNQNPRSVLVTGTYESQNIVAFLYIEGRNQRGSGMDIVQISDYLLNIPGLYITSAINLDGGYSSSITCLRDNTIFITNPTKFNAYPIGSVLSYAILNPENAPLYDSNNVILPNS